MEEIIDIIKLDHQGRGIGYINNIITFIPNALIGEQIKIKLTKQSKKYQEGEIISIMKASKQRITSSCEFYPQCGGCQFQHLSYENELIYKENKIKEITKKYADINESIINQIIPNVDLNYRNKVTLHVDKQIGYYQEKTQEVVAINKCLIADNKINQILNELKKTTLSDIDKVTIRVSEKDSLLVIYSNNNFVVSDELNLLVNNIVLFDGEKKIIKGKDYFITEIGKYKYQVSSESFFQVNTKGAKLLYDLIYNYVKGSKKVLDLYCGVGSIGIYISDGVEEVVGVEINNSAIEDALINKELNNIKNIEFINQDVSQYSEYAFDTIIVDPPRKGLDKITVDYLLLSQAEKIIYVACDPITLSRDLKLLGENYIIKEITPIDLFSRTYHVECVCLLERKYDMNKMINFKRIVSENLEIACKIQNEIFPEEDARENFIEQINNNPYRKEMDYYIVYLNDQPIGVTGIYSYNEYPDDAWLGWFGILKEYRNKGYATIVLNKTINLAKEKGYLSFRIYSDEFAKDAHSIYEKNGFLRELYDRDDDKDEYFPADIFIFSKNLANKTNEYWNNKFLGLKEQGEKENKYK